jgi:hypothetical protein
MCRLGVQSQFSVRETSPRQSREKILTWRRAYEVPSNKTDITIARITINDMRIYCLFSASTLTFQRAFQSMEACEGVEETAGETCHCLVICHQANQKCDQIDR